MAWWAPSHCLSQCSFIVNLNFRKKLWWNLDKITIVYIEIGIWKYREQHGGHHLRPQCIKRWDELDKLDWGVMIWKRFWYYRSFIRSGLPHKGPVIRSLNVSFIVSLGTLCEYIVEWPVISDAMMPISIWVFICIHSDTMMNNDIAKFSQITWNYCRIIPFLLMVL